MTTTLINTIDAKEQFADLINRVVHSKDRVVLTRRGKEIAALVSFEDFKLLLTSQDKHDLQEAIDALKESRQIGAITLEKIKEETGI